MAFGMSFGNNIGKFILTTVRIVASALIFVYLTRLVKKNEKPLIVYSFALIFAGAAGNIIDSLFYGVLFSKSTFFQVATFLPDGGGYAPMLFGKVVDMFYFPLIDTDLPSWIPLFGGRHISFFDAIFNFSDAAITIGVILLIIGIVIKDKEAKNKLNTEVLSQERRQSKENTEL